VQRSTKLTLRSALAVCSDPFGGPRKELDPRDSGEASHTLLGVAQRKSAKSGSRSFLWEGRSSRARGFDSGSQVHQCSPGCRHAVLNSGRVEPHGQGNEDMADYGLNLQAGLGDKDAREVWWMPFR